MLSCSPYTRYRHIILQRYSQKTLNKHLSSAINGGRHLVKTSRNFDVGKQHETPMARPAHMRHLLELICHDGPLNAIIRYLLMEK